MDLLRATIESCFYHFQPECIAEVLTGTTHTLNSSYSPKRHLLEIIKWNKPEFTATETKLIENIIDSDWMVNPTYNISKNDDFIKRIPLILNKFSQEVLICENLLNPKVKFDNLLRWRELSLLTGEDLLTIPFLALHDLERNLERTKFDWSNIILHDNFRLNSILDEELSDTHAHINAAMDVFEFNWLRSVNHPNDAFRYRQHNRNFTLDEEMLEYDTVKHDSTLFHNLAEWNLIASAIRIYLFEKLSFQSHLTDISRELLIAALNDKFHLEKLKTKVSFACSLLSNGALKSSNGYIPDYAIMNTAVDNYETLTSPFLIHHGERKLLYHWFRKYYSDEGDFRDTAGLMMLYLIVKIKMRREFIQSNKLSGFENFQAYNKTKSYFQPDPQKEPKAFSDYWEIAYKYAVQSSIKDGNIHYLEARVVPGSIRKFREKDYQTAIFSNEKMISDTNRGHLSFVAHFIKSADSSETIEGSVRHSKARKYFWMHDVKCILRELDINARQDGCSKLVGIDAASSELNCRPEILAPMFRYIRFKGLSNFTFHAGEDFYDLVDGIRTVDETLMFMDFRMGNRIGHGLALGQSPSKFYQDRHNTLVIPKQILMDNLVWMRYTADSANIPLNPTTQHFIETNFHQLASELGYTSFSDNMYFYWLSMLSRGDIIDCDSPVETLSDEIRYSPCSPKNNSVLRYNETIELLHGHYERNNECREKGNDAIMIRVPESYSKDVMLLQQYLLSKIENMGVVIETNPSSNVKIGRFERYDQHPITRFHSIDGISGSHSIVVSINTDDKGVFSTSLKNEYSLIAISLKKQKDEAGNRMWSDLQIEQYLRRIARYSNITRFRF